MYLVNPERRVSNLGHEDHFEVSFAVTFSGSYDVIIFNREIEFCNRLLW